MEKYNKNTTMSDKLVSVIIPVYNVEKFAEQAIVSIIKQTYKHLEIIVIDDGSSDNTYKIVADLATQDPRIRLYKNERNLKIVKTLNRALSLAQGEYIARMDGDDISALDRIEKQVAFLESNPDYELVGCSMILIDESGMEIGRSVKFSDYELLMKLATYEMAVAHPTWLARKSVYRKLNGYRELSGAEDRDFLLRMISAKLKYTNLETYFGVVYRADRVGGSNDTLGLRRRKTTNYIDKLYVERQKTGMDSFSEENLKQAIVTNIFWEKLYHFSCRFENKRLEAKHNKNFIKRLAYTFIVLISPHQAGQVFKIIKRKLIIRRHNHKFTRNRIS